MLTLIVDIVYIVFIILRIPRCYVKAVNEINDMHQ